MTDRLVFQEMLKSSDEEVRLQGLKGLAGSDSDHLLDALYLAL